MSAQNWPIWKRDVIIFLLSLLSVIAATLSPILAANTVSLAIYFGRSLTDMALLTGYHLLGVGIAGFLFVPSARIWGKRHVYLLGTVIIIISCIWAGATGERYRSFLWARIFQGVGLAPFEALVNASVGDLYHVHQRGVRMALSNFCVFGGAFFTPVLVGVIADRMGYVWTFYFVAIFAGCMLPVIVLFVPETAYRREVRFDIDTMGNLVAADGSELRVLANGSSEEAGSHATSKELARDSDHSPTGMHHGTAEHSGDEKQGILTPPPPPAKATFLQSIAPFNGRKTDERYLHLLLRPFSLFLHPGILWACLIQGSLIGFTVLIGVVLAAIMLGPPLWFGEVKTGYMYTGAFVGALLGFGLTGLVSDWSANLLTRLNHGVYEPEFRMVLVIPQLIFGCAGIYGFGWTSNDAARYGWFWPDFFFALVVMGMVCGAVASALYIVDAHRTSHFFFTTFSFNNTSAKQDWKLTILQATCPSKVSRVFSSSRTASPSASPSRASPGCRHAGNIKDVFVIVASVQVVICCLTIPMCMSSL